jgi:ATP synthase protein I
MSEAKKEKSSKSKQPNDFMRYTGMATKMAVVIGVAVYGGIKLDEKFSAEFPVWTLVLSMAGVGMAIYFVIKDSAPR